MVHVKKKKKNICKKFKKEKTLMQITLLVVVLVV